MAKETVMTKNGGLVPVCIPKKDRNDDDLYVAINGKRYLIQKGKTVMVPPEVKEVLDNAEMQDEAAQAFIDANAQ